MKILLACDCNTDGTNGDITCNGQGQCNCAEGYTGYICVSCADGYYSDNGACVPCGCNPNGDLLGGICSPQGFCSCDGQNGYMGPKCYQCLPTFYNTGGDTCNGNL